MGKKLIKKHDKLYIPEDFETNHVYYADEEGKKKYTGITTILNVISKPQLVPWAARMAVEYIEENWLNKLENGAVVTPKEVLEQAKTAYAKKRDDGAKKGTDTHALVEAYVNDCIEQYAGKPYRPYKNLEAAKTNNDSNMQVFANWAIKEDITFISAETPLVSEKYWVAGTADLIFEKDGKRYIGDIKTYKKIWDRTPMYQCAGYALMWEEMEENKEPLPPVDGEAVLTPVQEIHGYCIINLPKERDFDESQDVKWSFDVEGDTKAFLAALTLYRTNQNWK